MKNSKKTKSSEAKSRPLTIADLPKLVPQTYSQPKKIIFKNHQSPGDIVMLAYAIKALHEQYPGQYITGVDTCCNSIFEGNPYICWALSSADPTVKVISAEYNTIHKSNQSAYHFVNSFIFDFQEKLGIKLLPTEWSGAIFIRPEEVGWYSAVWEAVGKDVPFWIIDAGHKYDYTAKAWEYARFQQIVDRFPEITFVQIGSKEHYHPKLTGDNLVDLVGKTDLRQLIRLVFNSFGVITPVSMPMVLAYSIPPHPRYNRKSRACIVIAGGREPNHWQQGANQQYLHTCGMLSCCDLGGCWKSRILPLEDKDPKNNELCLCPIQSASGQIIPKCMDMISVDEVSLLIRKYMDNLEYTC
jgi:hypothetical protein